MTEKKYIAFIGIILLGVIALIAISFINEDIPPIIKTIRTTSELNTFNSLDELKTFVKERSEINNNVYGSGMRNFAAKSGAPVPAIASGSVASADASAESAGGSQSSDYSSTNIQVEGADEADIVKNDGKYIYTVTNNKVVILNAYPPQSMDVVSEIKANNNNDYIRDIFINGDKLIVFSEGYDSTVSSDSATSSDSKIAAEMAIAPDYYPYYSSTPKTYIQIYNISDRENPILDENIIADGNYITSRMIDDYVYVISTKWVEMNNPIPPIFTIGGVVRETRPTDIYYFNYYDSNYVFTNIMAVNVETSDFNSEVYLTGSTSNTFVSQDNIYLSYIKNVDLEEYIDTFMEDSLVPILPIEEQIKANVIINSDKTTMEKYSLVQEIVADYSYSLSGKEKSEFDAKLVKTYDDFQKLIAKEYEKTAVHKINVDKLQIEYITKGEVPGTVLNQFSMDEYNGNFRVATTTGNTWDNSGLNHLYVLDDNLKIIGKVEDLAKGERIYSARFIGDRAYMVTFKNTDPFYVIDLSNPSAPKVLGYLKIPGYSNYLHPYDSTHIIGIGKNTAETSDEESRTNFAYYQGLKLSLFDVSDVENPKEVAKIVIGDRGTDSSALYDHKAFLFDKQRGIIVIPVSLAKINESRYLKENGEIPSWAYGDIIWQGAYVLNIDTNEISVRGKITHNDIEINPNDYWYYGGYNQIQRSLYMDNYLYTVSQSKIKANDLSNMDEISEVKIWDVPEYKDYPVYDVEDRAVF